MTDEWSATPAQAADRYRELARSVRALIPLMQHPEVRDQLGVLALQYEKLAQRVEAESLRNPTAEFPGAASLDKSPAAVLDVRVKR
jgi:hypothetical protein